MYSSNGFFWSVMDATVCMAYSISRSAFRTPLLMQLADREMLYAMQTVASMTDQKKPFEEYIYPDEFHTKRWPAHRLTIYQRNLDWLAFWLKGEEDPNPAKTDQ